jgi:flagellar hook protein FlgE
MLRSLYSGVSGLKSQQTKMDIVGNNIANSTTIGFKSGRVLFNDLFSQTVANAQGPSDSLGGVNPKQVGLGVKVGAIDTIMTNGSLQSTGRSLDFAIEGEGFFTVSSDSAATSKNYTRDGAFYTDYDGNLVNSSGYYVLGYPVNPPIDGVTPATPESPIDAPAGTDPVADLALMETLQIPDTLLVDDGAGGSITVELDSYSIDGTGLIQGVYSDGYIYTLGQIGVCSFNNPDALEKVGSNLFVESNNSGSPEPGVANDTGYGAIRQSVLEMSNVDLANEFTEMIITSRAYAANSRTITTSDELLQELVNLKR